MTPRAIITDIEGTTSSLSFVHEVLFPYSRTRLASYVREHAEEVAPLLDAARVEVGDPQMNLADCITQLIDWHDQDRKIGPLKTLQAMIWAEGFAAGELEGHIYADAVAGLRRWQARGIPLYVYSSGAIAAQKLLFRHSKWGDLTQLFSGHFDTAVGAKKEPASYGAIVNAIGLPAADLLFLSDVEAELEAAQKAGLSVMLLVREGPFPDSPFPAVANFDPILAGNPPA